MLTLRLVGRGMAGLALSACCLASSPLLAEGHSHKDAAATPLAAPTKKLPTDATLRSGMGKVAEVVGTRWPSIIDSRLTGPDYVSLAKAVRGELATVIANCRLPRASDQTFHEILKDMEYALELMESPRMNLQRTGAFALGQALGNYGRYFDHPGWPLIWRAA